MHLSKKYYLFLFFFSLSFYFFGQSDIRFHRYSVDDGLSQNTIYTILQDNEGFLWFGTDDGLNRFDGQDFINFMQHDLANDNSLSSNQIKSVLQDHKGNLWVGTNNGLNKINRSQHKNTRFFHKTDELSLSDNFVQTLLETNDHLLWIGTKIGVSVYDINADQFMSFDALNILKTKSIVGLQLLKQDRLAITTTNALYEFNLKTKILSKSYSFKEGIEVMCLILDHDASIWVGTYQGLMHLSPNYDLLKYYKHHENDNTTISNNDINGLYLDNNNALWIGTDTGLNLYNRTSNDFTRYMHDPKNPSTISYSVVNCIYQDSGGIIWLGSFKGLSKMFLGQRAFNHFIPYPKYTNKPDANIVWNFIEDQNNNLWISTGDGLHVYNNRQDLFKTISSTDTIETTNYLILYSMTFDHYGNLWVGGNNGLYYLTRQEVENIWKNKTPILKKIDNAFLKDLRYITGISRGSKPNEIWIATIEDGIIKVEHNDLSKTNEVDIVNYRSTIGDESSLASNTAISIKIINDRKVCIGTQRGLNILDPITEEFEYINLHPDAANHTEIAAMTLENDSTLWIGTYNIGLIKFNLKNYEYQTINTKGGLANNSIYSVLIPQGKSEIWVSTNKGVSKIDKKSGEIVNYTKNQGLQDTEFSQGAGYLGKNNKLYFGGINGYNAFYPQLIQPNTIPPQIQLTELKIFDQKINPNTSSKALGLDHKNDIILNRSISHTDTITLSHNHSVFTFKVASLHFQDPKVNQYAYKLEGVDPDWNYRRASSNQFTYTNLSPDTYTLKLKAANSDGIWSNPPKEITIQITPPFWQTTWFYLLCILVLLASVYIMLYVWRKQIKLKERRDFLRKENELKTAMLREIHHRIKNNLHVVNSLLRIQSAKIEDQNVVQIFKKAQSRVLSMAILHEKMYQTKNLNDINAQDHFEPLIRDLIEAYGLNKDIELDLKISSVQFDMATLVPLSLIINELISNSLKYAFADQDSGKITIHLNETGTNKDYELIVGDNGKGIEPNVGKRADQIGTKLIATFVKQLKGKIELLKQPGTFYHISFKGQ